MNQDGELQLLSEFTSIVCAAVIDNQKMLTEGGKLPKYGNDLASSVVSWNNDEIGHGIVPDRILSRAAVP